VIFELFADLTPRTCENFRALCTGECGFGKKTKKKLSYDGCSFFRSSKGFMVQSGDFQFNNGDGGESIYGGAFNDEDFTRRHTQAGILSMANKGRNSNTSQFFVTLKRAPQLDARHVAFGQVIEGMDVIRAIAQVPTDLDERPRVPVKIVACGQVDRKTTKQDDPHLKVANQIAGLIEDEAPTKVQEATKGKAILAGKPGGAVIDDSATKQSGAADEEEVEDGSAALAPPRNERERRLHELRMRMNQARSTNSKEVVEEQKRHADPDYSKKKAEERTKRALEKEENPDGKDDIDGGGKRGKAGDLPKSKAYMGDTQQIAEMKEAKKKKGNPDAFGWDVFNQDSLYRANEKRLNEVVFDEKGYQAQKEQLAVEDSSMFEGFGYKATDEQKDRLAAAMDKSQDKKKAYSRRRTYNPEEDCNYVNDRNRHFNKKMERFFGEYTTETRQNLERGTAL